MDLTIERLMQGHPEIPRRYQAAREHWEGILGGLARPIDVPRLAERLRMEQPWFEENCGGRYLGQEIMAVVGIGHLFGTEDVATDVEETAAAIVAAFRQSTCSIETKEALERVAALYDVQGVEE